MKSAWMVLGVIFSVSARASDLSLYDDFFPHYLEYCAATQIKPIDQEQGGYGGHAVIYVHGLCKNENAEYPVVEACEMMSKQRNPHRGVGISVDKYFKNVNWVAVPGYEFFISGNLKKTDRVDPSRQLYTTAEAAYNYDVFKGVIYDESQVPQRLLSEDKKNNTRFYELAISNLALGTDFALTWGRSLECFRLPLVGKQIYTIRDYLNRLNDKYHREYPKTQFEWSAYFNNCSHTSSNAFAAIGARDHLETDTSWWWQAFNIGNPANPVRTLKYLHQRKAANLSDVSSGGKFESSFKEYGSVPTQAGTLTVNHPILKDNALFLTDTDAFVALPKKLHLAYAIYDWHNNQSQKAVYTDLEANLRLWSGRYREAIQSLNSETPILTTEKKLKKSLIDYYKSMLESTESKLKLMK